MNTTGNLLRLNPEHEHFPKILELDHEQFPKPWSTGDWENLNWDHHHLFGWQVQNQLLGFALFSFIPNDDTAHLLKICLHIKLRGSGQAQLMWNNCQSELKQLDVKGVFLEVEADNLRAIGFYKKLKFETLRTIKAYYSDGSDAVTMRMTI